MAVAELLDAWLADAEVNRENANSHVSVNAFFSYVAQERLKDETLRLLNQDVPGAARLHLEGWLHIHDLPYIAYIGYCTGWNIRNLFVKGLRTPIISARPAKHMDSAVDHVVNFLVTAQHEWSGAQACSSLDAYLAVFAAKDKLSPCQVEQNVQRLVYNLNFPSRSGDQTPFTNVQLSAGHELGDEPAFVGGEPAGSLSDFAEERDMVFEAFCKVLLQGDDEGRPFTFPIPTLILTNESFKKLPDIVWEVAARRGSFYFINAVAHPKLAESTLAMCCRLTIDVKTIALFNGTKAHGLWALPDGTGSIGVVTLNLPRLACEEDFEGQLHTLMSYARRILNWKRKRVQKNLERGLLPITKEYLGTFSFHYNTIGLIGLPEAAAIACNESWWPEPPSKRSINRMVSWMKKVVDDIAKEVERWGFEDQCLWNVEQVPGESCGGRLRKLDSRYGVHVDMPEGVPYSNSIVPYYANVPLWTRIEAEAEVQPAFSGGVMMHIFLNQQPDPQALKRLVERICRTKIVYFSLTPTVTRCLSCKHSAAGLYKHCPYCGSNKVEWWSRIVGYYRPVHNWNPARRKEFEYRVPAQI